jgi:hypothetical protein
LNEISVWDIFKNTKEIISLDCNDIYAMAWSRQDELFIFGETNSTNYLWNATLDEIILEIE